MGDSNGKKPGVPSWQLKLKETIPTEGDTDPEPSRETVVAQAKKFLEEDEVRNASTDKKIAFLESKGLTDAEIQDLLGVTRNVEATALPSSAIQSPSTVTTPPQPQPQSIQSQPTQQYTSPPQQQQSTPPIITYPEFLTTSPSPTPLVTKARLLSTLYAFSAISFLLYGTNTYLLTPMLAQLTTSRLSLAESANTNLKTLIEKLEGLVSEIPVHTKAELDRKKQEEESEDEDPTELFHRDIGIQTSLPSSPIPSRPSSPIYTAVDKHTSRLTVLSSHLSSQIQDSTNEGTDISELSTTVAMLREYLDGLAYVTPSYGYGVGGYAGVAGVGGAGKEDDEIGRVKVAIRGVKGVLLSARSFPGVRTGR